MAAAHLASGGAGADLFGIPYWQLSHKIRWPSADPFTRSALRGSDGMACNRPNDGTGIRIVRMTGLAPVDLTAHELDRLAGHCRRYTTGRLREMLRCHPVQIVRLDYMNPIGGLGWGMEFYSPATLLFFAAGNCLICFFVSDVLVMGFYLRLF